MYRYTCISIVESTKWIHFLRPSLSDVHYISVNSFLYAFRAMAGGKTISENYAFAGMHHIFDQHTAAGIILVQCTWSSKASCCQYLYIN